MSQLLQVGRKPQLLSVYRRQAKEGTCFSLQFYYEDLAFIVQLRTDLEKLKDLLKVAVWELAEAGAGTGMTDLFSYWSD